MPGTHAMAARSKAVALLVGVLALIAGIGPAAVPASAHSAGKAVVLVRDFMLTPATGGKWQATVVIADFDSGAPLQGTSVTIGIGSPATKFAQLNPTTQIGQYQAVVGKAAPGPASFELRVRTVPGSPPVQPYDHTYAVTLVAGAPLHVVAGAGGGGGGSNLPMMIIVFVVVLAGAALYGLFSLRRRTDAPPASASSEGPVRSGAAN
jgi:hypothetical protein